MEQKLDLAFVLLHCVSAKITKRAIDSIVDRIDIDRYKIIIVNQGFEHSGIEKLKKLYLYNKKIEILYSSKNVGFAMGNNIGIKYIHSNYKVKFVVLMNNDVILLENSLFLKLNNRYLNTKFGVAGPMIITKNGWCRSNPGPNNVKSLKKIKNVISEYYIKLYLTKFHLRYLIYIWDKCQRILSSKNNYKNFLESQTNVMLHGCFLVLSDKFFEKLEGLDNRTFLYVEEELLQLHCLYHDIKMDYISEMIIYHDEDAETNRLYKSARSKMMLMYSNYVSSYKVLLETRKSYLLSDYIISKNEIKIE